MDMIIILKINHLQSFDRAVWNSVIDECIIGGLDADGNDDPYKITFIYKTGDKGSGNGLNYKSPRKNAKDKLCSLSTDSVSTKENQDTWRRWSWCQEYRNNVLEVASIKKRNNEL